MPTGGGYGSGTEYEIGAQRIAEAAHCILGSLGRKHTGSGATTDWTEEDWESVRRVERGHILEEIDIINRCMKEYSRDLYVERIVERGPQDQYVARSIKSIKDNSPKLKELAGQEFNQLVKHKDDIPRDIISVAAYCYGVIESLAKAMLLSVYKWPNMETSLNAFNDRELKERVDILNNNIKKIYDD